MKLKKKRNTVGGYKSSAKRRMSTRKKIMSIVLVVILLIIAVPCCYFFYEYSRLQRPTSNEFNLKNVEMNTNNFQVATGAEIVSSSALPTTGYTNIAIFGVDARDLTTLKKDVNTDAIIIASINNANKEVKLVSIYRDTYLKRTDNDTFAKVNSAYAVGGAELALSTLNKNLDLNLTKFVTVNFGSAEELINLLGGVTIDVQENEVKHLNNYVRTLHNEIIRKYGEDAKNNELKYIDGPGVQVLNGSQAVAYMRIRYTAGNDFKRTERQRTVLNEVLKEAKKADLATLLSIIDAMADDIYTNLSMTDIIALAKDVFSYDIKESIGFPFNAEGVYDYAGRSVVISNDLRADIEQLHSLLYENETYIMSQTVNEILYELSLKTFYDEKP